jgi:hypothetical protein
MNFFLWKCYLPVFCLKNLKIEVYITVTLPILCGCGTWSLRPISRTSRTSGTSAKQLRKATVSLVILIRLPIHPPFLMELWLPPDGCKWSSIVVIFFMLNCVDAIRCWFKSDQNHRHLIWRRTYIFADGLYNGDSVILEYTLEPKNQLTIKTSRLLRDKYRKSYTSPLKKYKEKNTSTFTRYVYYVCNIMYINVIIKPTYVRFNLMWSFSTAFHRSPLRRISRISVQWDPRWGMRTGAQTDMTKLTGPSMQTRLKRKLIRCDMMLRGCMISGFRRDVHEIWILRSVEWYFCADVSEQPISSIFKGQEVQVQGLLEPWRWDW